jgi:hypothetical protein
MNRNKNTTLPARKSPSEQYVNSSPNSKNTHKSVSSKRLTKSRNIIILLIILLLTSLSLTGYLLITNSSDTEADQKETSNTEDSTSNTEDTVNTNNSSVQNSESSSETEQNEPDNQTTEEDSNDINSNDPPPQQDDDEQSNPYEGWATYTNQLYGYSIKYPNNWSVTVHETQTCPEMVTGCREIKNKGDFVEITRATNVGFTIKVNNDIETDGNYGCSALSVGDPIKMDGKTIKTLYLNDAFNMIVKKYDTKEINGETAICPYSYWTEKGNTYFIGAYAITGPSSSDNATIIKMLKSLDF